MKIAISSDSTCSISQKKSKELGIYILGAGGKSKSPSLYLKLRDKLEKMGAEFKVQKNNLKATNQAYCKLYLNLCSYFNIECDIIDELKTSLNVEVENKYISISETNDIDITTYLKDSNTEYVDFKAYIKTSNGLVETNSIYTRSKIKGSESGISEKLYLDSNIETGIYQLEFRNNDKVVIVNIIIK